MTKPVLSPCDSMSMLVSLSSVSQTLHSDVCLSCVT